MNLIYKALVGSQAYGTATPESDYDYKGVYIQPIMDIVTYNYKPQIETNKDDTSYEIRRFIELAQTANPTILELLFMPTESIVTITPEFEMLRDVRHLFLTKKCKDSFAGYARQQIAKANGLQKKGNWEKSRIERKDIMDFCYISIGEGKSKSLKAWLDQQGWTHLLENDPDYSIGLTAIPNMPQTFALYISEDRNVVLRGVDNEGTSNNVRLSSIPLERNLLVNYCGVVHFNLNAYQIHCKEYKEYQTWLKERNTARYVDFEKHGQMIDGKNMLHCVRLIDVATEIATTGELNVKRPNADYLLSIRRGEVSLTDILENSKEKLKGLDDLFNKSDLPDNVSTEFCNHLLRSIRELQITNEYISPNYSRQS